MLEAHDNTILAETIEAAQRFSLANNKRVAVVEFDNRPDMPKLYEIVSEDFLKYNTDAKLRRNINCREEYINQLINQ